MKHWIVMGGISGCMPEHCNAFATKQDAIESIRDMYGDVHLPAWTNGPAVIGGRYENRYMNVAGEVARTGICYDVGYGDPKYDLCYVSIEPCDCDAPWEHSEDDTPRDWRIDLPRVSVSYGPSGQADGIVVRE